MMKGYVKKSLYAGAVLGMMMATPAFAGTGLDNATLEDLKQLIMAQQKQIEAQNAAIEALQTGQKESAKQVADIASKSNTKSVLSGNDTVSLRMYGQVNRAVMFADDGNNSEVYHVDNDNSSTRFGMTGVAKPSKDLAAGFKFEAEFEGNSSNSVSQAAQDTDATLKKRHLDLFLKSKQYGNFYIGQGDTASNGTSEIDLSGTKVIGFSEQPKMGGNIKFYDSLAGAYSANDIGDVLLHVDGLSRRDRLRYDTPTWNGFYAAVSAAERNGQDLALRYSGKLGGAKLAAGVAYSKPGGNDNDVDNQINGSASILFGNGFNATVAAGTQDLSTPAAGQDDPSFWYGKLGYIAKPFKIGSTAFAIDYGQYDDKAQAGDDANTFGLMAVQKLNDWGTEFYASYRMFSLDRAGTDMEDIDVFMAGARIKF